LEQVADCVTFIHDGKIQFSLPIILLLASWRLSVCLHVRKEF